MSIYRTLNYRAREKDFLSSFSLFPSRPEILRKHFPLRRMSTGISSVCSGLAENRKSEIVRAEGGRRGFLS